MIFFKIQNVPLRIVFVNQVTYTYHYYIYFRLDETLTIKIADFGLSRDVYISDYYVMKHSNPLPVKWLAPEVIFDGVFSVKSDVVSI